VGHIDPLHENAIEASDLVRFLILLYCPLVLGVMEDFLFKLKGLQVGNCDNRGDA
jgi:putative effector of murein hydrolase LrgA (UPF0299 family)